MLIAYLRERFRARLFVPLGIAIAAAVRVESAPWSVSLLDVGFALLLLAQFRLWDDLADRSRDAATHPDRVLVRTGSVTPAIAFCGGLAVLNLCLAVWRDGSGVAVSVLAALMAVLAVWYLARTGRTVSAEQLLLSKYPAFVVIVAGERVFEAPVQVLGLAALLYVAVCIYEALHDPDGPLSLSWGLRPQTPCAVARGAPRPAPLRRLTRYARSRLVSDRLSAGDQS